MSKNLLLIPIVALQLSACASDNKRAATGAGIGAAAGAGIGAIVGNQYGKSGTGALIGGAFGTGVGGMIGHRMDTQAKELKKVAETKRTESGIVSKLKSDILFDTGKSDLKPTATGNLTQMAEILRKYPENVITVNGFTDNTGSENFNQTLSTSRADAVRDALVVAGVPAASVHVIGMGSAQPVASNSDANGRAKNRRVEIDIKADANKLPADRPASDRVE